MHQCHLNNISVTPVYILPHSPAYASWFCIQGMRLWQSASKALSMRDIMMTWPEQKRLFSWIPQIIEVVPNSIPENWCYHYNDHFTSKFSVWGVLGAVATIPNVPSGKRNISTCPGCWTISPTEICHLCCRKISPKHHIPDLSEGRKSFHCSPLTQWT